MLARYLWSPRSGLIGQLLRFGMAGGTVTLFYLVTTTLLYKLAALPFQAALAIGFSLSLLLHFTLQRLFVWIHYEGFALPFGHQVGRYLAMAGAQYGCTVAATATLPSRLGVSTELVYLVTMAIVTTLGFLIMRFIIFHAEAPLAEASAAASGGHEWEREEQELGPPSQRSPSLDMAAGDRTARE